MDTNTTQTTSPTEKNQLSESQLKWMSRVCPMPENYIEEDEDGIIRAMKMALKIQKENITDPEDIRRLGNSLMNF